MVKTAAVQSSFGKKVVTGILGGAAGGIVFGMLMAMMGMLTTIAGMAGSTSIVVGAAIHMMISVFIGATFGVLFGANSTTAGRGLLFGIVYGMVWWVLGPLVIMPVMMGMGLQFANALSGSNLMSLMGHMIFGAVTGLVYFWVARRS
ncbi:MAG TPA: hypothetical protein VGK87_02545 [Anaerolineae bacterium]|jgi:uncharacterized membrane protein YagU involved in acid resistance